MISGCYSRQLTSCLKRNLQRQCYDVSRVYYLFVYFIFHVTIFIQMFLLTATRPRSSGTKAEKAYPLTDPNQPNSFNFFCSSKDIYFLSTEKKLEQYLSKNQSVFIHLFIKYFKYDEIIFIWRAGVKVIEIIMTPLESL